MKNYWLISDTHFNHEEIEKWGGRTGDWQKRLWDGIKEIPPQDVLIHLGDILIGKDAEIHEKIVEAHPFGPRILVRGNHDHKSLPWYLEHGWDFVCDQIGLEYHGVDLLLSHRPMPPDTWRYKFNIHGHTHGDLHRAEEYSAWYDPTFHIDISPEIVGFKPLRLDTLMKKHKI